MEVAWRTVGAIRRMLEDFPLEISQRLICFVGSMRTRVVMEGQHAFGEESWSRNVKWEVIYINHLPLSGY
jgi:hypothetical protein